MAVKESHRRGDRTKERAVRIAIRAAFGDDPRLPAIFALIENQREP